MRALLLDFDGVIVDSEHLHDLALREVCEPLGFTWQGDAWVGWPDAEVLIELHRRRGEALPAERLATLLEQKTSVVLAQVSDQRYRAYPGVVELIREAARAVPVAVCSAGLRGQIVPVLEFLGIAGDIGVVVAFEDTARSKPDPAPYLLGASRVGVPPHECVAIEDSPRGVASAKAAGCTVIAVAHTSPVERLSAADLVVGKIGELTLASLRAASARARA
jgi:HAD superfamily hydrolase (TIGR01509 family)